MPGKPETIGSIALALATFSDDELKWELRRRDDERMREFWERRKSTAKYLCSSCGEPDGYHTTNCPSDMGFCI